MINAFSRHNAHHVEITDKLSELKKQLENINEAKEELELQIEDNKVSYFPLCARPNKTTNM